MKPLKFKLIVLLSFLTFFYGSGLAQNKLSKELKKEFAVNENSQLVLDNRYGSITVKDWDKNLVSIEVLITVENSRKETAERYLEYIDIEFSKEEDVIKAKTLIDERYGRSGTRSIVINSDNKLSVDYTVNMPKNLKANISQRYGDVFINELTGEVSMDIRYGNLTINKLTRGNDKPLAFVSLAYSKGFIAEANWLNVDMKYSEIKVDRSQAIVVVSKYSKLYADNSSSVVANSRYDRYNLGDLNNLVINGAYTNIDVNSVSNRLEVETRYGGVKVARIPANFNKISIKTNYANVNLGIAAAASYILDGNVAYGNINYPSNNKVSKISGNRETKVNGLIGTNERTGSEVSINARYGNVSLVR